MRGKGRTISVVRALAERQHGVFARRQLVGLGIRPKLIDRWLDAGRIVTVRRGVYALSERLLARHGRWMAAVLAVGPDAALSHGSGGALWRVAREPGGLIHVTTPRRPRAQDGIALHCLPLAADEVTVHDGIPVTTPARTLFDIASRVSFAELARAAREAEYLRLFEGPSLPELLARYPGKAGSRHVRRLLEEGWSAAPTRSALEARFTDFIREYDLPRPERNALIELPRRVLEVDFLWRDAQLVAELDGYEAHGARQAFEGDRERDLELQVAGFRVVRITWRRLRSRRAELARSIDSLIAAAAADPHARP